MNKFYLDKSFFAKDEKLIAENGNLKAYAFAYKSPEIVAVLAFNAPDTTASPVSLTTKAPSKEVTALFDSVKTFKEDGQPATLTQETAIQEETSETTK